MVSKCDLVSLPTDPLPALIIDLYFATFLANRWVKCDEREEFARECIVIVRLERVSWVKRHRRGDGRWCAEVEDDDADSLGGVRMVLPRDCFCAIMAWWAAGGDDEIISAL